jgi:hypothetical protein
MAANQQDTKREETASVVSRLSKKKADKATIVSDDIEPDFRRIPFLWIFKDKKLEYEYMQW